MGGDKPAQEAATDALAAPLGRGLETLGLAASPDQIRQLLDYLALLERWNRVYNLTAIRDPAAMVSQHLLDSAAIIPYIWGNHLLDVGTGAGLPGIPVAILCPQREVLMLDANAKKTRFVQQVIAALGLENARVVHSRVEAYRPGEGFETITARAFSSLAELLQRVHHLCVKRGIVLAMKGPRGGQELAELPAGFTLLDSQALAVPGLEARRQVIRIQADDINQNTETGE